MVYKYDEYEWETYERSVSANDVGKFCESMEEQGMVVTKKSFLDASRPEEAITHPLFEWDDAVAAERYRLHQSGKHLNDLKGYFTMEEPETKEPIAVKIVAYSNVNPGSSAGVYKNTLKAMATPNDKEVILKRARREMVSFCEKYRALKELADAIEVLQKCIERLDDGIAS